MTNEQYYRNMKYRVALETALSFTADRLGVDLEIEDEKSRLWEALTDVSSEECREFARLLTAGMMTEDAIDSCLAL